MIRDALIAIALAACVAPIARAQSTSPPSTAESTTTKADTEHVDVSIDKYRTPLEALNEGMIGAASRPVRFDWRKSYAMFGVMASDLIELNNFTTNRIGAFGRKAFGDFLGEVAITYATSQGSESSEKLSLTPYRQAGRPNRLELDVNALYPVAEGVVTPVTTWIPPAELVFSGIGGGRYLSYPWALGGLAPLDIGKALVSPGLTDREVQNLEPSRVPGMEIDRGRYELMGGVNLDVYVQPGVVISPRAMVAIPLLDVVTGSKLGWWWELSITAGYAL